MTGEARGDNGLVERARSGEKRAFDALFGRYLRMVRGEARRYGLRPAEGDVIQETFLRAYLGLGELGNPAKFGAWLRTIAQRVCATELRDQRRRESAGGELAAAVPRPERDHRELRELLAGLPREDREPLHLYYVLGLDSAAAAKALGVKPGAFRVRLHRARQRARKLAASQRIEEILMTTDKSREEIAQDLLAEALSATEVYDATHIDDWDKHRRKLEEALEADPDCLDAAWHLARKLSRDGEYRRALELLQKLHDAGHADTWTMLTMAWTLDYLGRREEALQCYARTALSPFLSETQRVAARAGIEEPQMPKKPPQVPDGLVELPHTGWQAQASHDEVPPAYAIDGDPNSGWSPRGDGQSPGMWLRIDLGEQVEGLAGIWLDDDAGGKKSQQNNSPRHCLVSVSRDGEWWKRVGEWRWGPNRYMESWWEPISARYLLLEQAWYNHPEWWSVYEAHVYRAG